MYCLSVVNCLETDLKPFSNKMFFFRKDCFYFVVTFVVLNELTDDFAALCAILGEIVFSELKLLRC